MSAVEKNHHPPLNMKMQANSELSPSPGWPFPSPFSNVVLCRLGDVQKPYENRDGVVSSKREVTPSTAEALHLAPILRVPPLVLKSLWQQQNTTKTQEKKVLDLFITIKCCEGERGANGC